MNQEAQIPVLVLSHRSHAPLVISPVKCGDGLFPTRLEISCGLECRTMLYDRVWLSALQSQKPDLLAY